MTLLRFRTEQGERRWLLALVVLVELALAVALSAYQTPNNAEAIVYQRF